MALNIWKISICLILGLVAAHAESSYCQLCRDHTMCIYSGTSGSCGTVIRQQLTNAEQDALVNIHNTYRSKVARGLETRGSPGPQPSASNMRKMNWNDELATIAQTWANQCAFGHDSCRKTSSMSVGQNVYLYMSYGTGNSADNFDVTSAISAFYDEVAYYSRNDINPFRFSGQTGHYTQVVWANTYQVGCGYIKYKVGSTTYSYVVCNYGPSGNYLGQELYKTGAACSQCGTMVCDTTYPGLCR